MVYKRLNIENLVDRGESFYQQMMTSVVQELQQKGSCLLCSFLFSVLWRCWLGGRKGIQSVKSEWWVAGMAICLKWGADLHIAQLMPLPLTVSCFSWIQIGFTFWYRLTWVVPDKGPLYGCMHFSYMDFSLNSLDVIQKDLLCRHSLRCCWLLTVVGFNERWRFSKKYIIKFTGLVLLFVDGWRNCGILSAVGKGSKSLQHWLL